jgi:hypothetical protein
LKLRLAYGIAPRIVKRRGTLDDPLGMPENGLFGSTGRPQIHRLGASPNLIPKVQRMAQSLKIFRKHDRVLKVILTGLAMISFVLLGATGSSSASDMPPILIVIALAAMVGGAAWVLGLINNKSSEYGMGGAALGAVLGVFITWSRPTSVVAYVKGSDISISQVDELADNRVIANQFVRMAFQKTNGFDPLQFGPAFARQYIFGFVGGDGTSDGDLVITELLLREADRLGIQIPNDAVFDFINDLAFNPDKSLTRKQFAELREQLKTRGRGGVSEARLLQAIGQELKAKRAAEMLFRQPEVPAASLWDYYRKLHMTEEADVAVVPISDFLDTSVEPPADELAKLFAEYRENEPGVTKEGRIEEGRPGFHQPPRSKIAYLEAVYDDFEKKVPEVTDAEIEKRYEESYKKPLINIDDPLAPLGGDRPPAPPSAEPVDDAAAPLKTPDLPGETKPDAPAVPPEPAPPTNETQPSDNPAPSEEKPKEESAPPEKSSSSLDRPSSLKFVAAQDETPPADQPAETKPAEPAADSPKPDANAEPAKTDPAATKAAEKPETPAEGDQPAETPPATDPAKPDPAATTPADPAAPGLTAPAAEKPAGSKSPDPPLPTIRPLDDALRAEIREAITRERADELMDQAIQKGIVYMTEDIGLAMNTAPDDELHLTPEAASKKLKEFAAKEGLVYVETPWLSYQELKDSEDYPIGSAYVLSGQGNQIVADEVARIFGRNQKYAQTQKATSFATRSYYAYWVIDEKPGFEPKDMEDPIVKEQVVKIWRERQAREKARARAEELVKQLVQSDKSMSEALGETTITGKPGTGYVTIRPTGKFSWYRLPSVPPTGMRQQEPPRLTEIPSLKPLGEEFMTKVFDAMKPGDVSTADSGDKSEIYVVKVLSRNPSTPEELEAFRQRFLALGMTPAYRELAQRDFIYYGRNGIDELWKRHEVQLVDRKDRVQEEM